MPTLISALAGLTLALTTYASTLTTAEYEIKPKEPEQPDATITALINCESGNRWDIRILDTNNAYSYGGLQYQIATFKRYGEKYNLIEKGLGEEALRTLVYSRDLQIKVTREVLKEPLGIYNWYNCGKKLDLIKK